ncbi:MAG: hypothetical protein MK033_12390 [Candidatus Caenarcaniphilales bacterium]|nr:hypothetical protein [Candidatus Caenarcaniphilales bacterium]
MNQNSTLKIKYSKVFSIFIILSSLFTLYAFSIAGKFSLIAVVNYIFLIVGILMLTRPIALITHNNIIMMNLLGMKLKVYSYTPDELQVTNSMITLGDTKLFLTWLTDINVRELREFLLKINSKANYN